MREYWIQVGENKSKEEIKKLREENDGFKQKIDELKAQNADLQVEVELKKACLKMQDFGYTCGLKIAKEEMEIAYNQAIDDAANAVMRTTLMSVDLDKKLKKLKKK